jgi:hypothetical protein
MSYFRVYLYNNLSTVYLQCSQYLDIYWFYQVIDKGSHEPLVFSHSVLSLQAYYIFMFWCFYHLVSSVNTQNKIINFIKVLLKFQLLMLHLQKTA